MRHAQSDDFARSSDFERPLSAGGQQDAAHMRDCFHAHGYHPQSALVSAAKRTAETYDLLQLENCPAFFQNLFILPPQRRC
jgi:phosphohistidine phosphatase